jgi:hypothetical protein
VCVCVEVCLRCLFFFGDEGKMGWRSLEYGESGTCRQGPWRRASAFWWWSRYVYAGEGYFSFKRHISSQHLKHLLTLTLVQWPSQIIYLQLVESGQKIKIYFYQYHIIFHYMTKKYAKYIANVFVNKISRIWVTSLAVGNVCTNDYHTICWNINVRDVGCVNQTIVLT